MGKKISLNIDLVLGIFLKLFQAYIAASLYFLLLGITMLSIWVVLLKAIENLYR